MPSRHRGDRDDPGQLDLRPTVPVTSVDTRFEAEILVAALQARGIRAVAVHSERGGWHRVMVFEDDAEISRVILAEPR